MSDLLRPGWGRGGDLVDDRAVLAAMIAVEDAWLSSLVATGIAPAEAAVPLAGLVTGEDLVEITARSESAGNPVVPLVELLRERARADHPLTAAWLHRGLTSQDVLDTALMMISARALDQVIADVRAQLARLVDLAELHAQTVMVARTLTQYAVPTTFGLKAANWAAGVCAAAEDVLRVRRSLTVQAGGAAGTRAAWLELARIAGRPPVHDAAQTLLQHFTGALALASGPPWHTNRRPVTGIGDALVALTDAWGLIANDVLLMSRPEVAEVSLAGGGGSSTMPHKRNPVLAILVRRAALAAPMLGAQLHLAAADTVDERPDGAWHLEWDALRSLLGTCAAAASQTTEVLGTLTVHTDTMRDRVDAAADQVLSERAGIRAALDAEPADDGDVTEYLGAAAALVRELNERVATTLKELR